MKTPENKASGEMKRFMAALIIVIGAAFLVFLYFWPFML